MMMPFPLLGGISGADEVLQTHSHSTLLALCDGQQKAPYHVSCQTNRHSQPKALYTFL